MSQEELLPMSQKERDRLQVLKQARSRQITQAQAAAQLEVSERWVRELLRRMKKRGDVVVVHGLRGKPGNRRIAAAVRERAVRVVRKEYGDFGPTLASEYLAERHGVAVSRETLRGWMMGAQLWKPRGRRIERVHVWRPRREQAGELVQWDTSEHDWLEGRGGPEKLYLILLIDDASSRALARFVRHDSTAENLRTLGEYLRRWGRPQAVYTDKAGLFVTSRPQQRDEQLRGALPKTQIGRALEELDVRWIAAHSPQAKGRVERFFGTAQDRLVKGLRKAGARTLQQAQRYLEQVYLPLWNRRFAVAPANPVDAHRALAASHDLAAILSHVETRTVAADYTIRLEQVRYQIAREAVVAGLRGARVRVEQRLDGELAVRFGSRYVPVRVCPQSTARPAPAAPSAPPAARPARSGGRRHNWMRGFQLQGGPPLWSLLKNHPAGRAAGGVAR
jgi:DNA-binding Lrp family transcriptional regulator